MRTALIFATVLCLGIAAASAQNATTFKLSTGRDFLATCGRIDVNDQDTSPSAAIADIECVYYVTGVMDGIHDVKGPDSMEAAGICISPSVTLMDLTKSVIHLVRSKEEYLDTRTNVLIYMTLLQSYPCH